MQTTAQPRSMPVAKTKAVSHPWLMLISRSVLFLFFQALIALIFFATETKSAWDESVRWWTFVAALTNFASIYFLVRLLNAEEKRYFEVFGFSRATWKADLLWFIGASIIISQDHRFTRDAICQYEWKGISAEHLYFRNVDGKECTGRHIG